MKRGSTNSSLEIKASSSFGTCFSFKPNLKSIFNFDDDNNNLVGNRKERCIIIGGCVDYKILEQRIYALLHL